MIAKALASNNAGSKLAASILAADTSLTLTAGGGVNFASPSGGNYETITISDQATGLIREVIWFTARSGDTLSGLVRGREGTTARDWAVYDPVEVLFTAGLFAKLAQDPSDQLGGVAAVQTYAGNPNGFVAGNAATVGGLPPSLVWDAANKVFWVCTTTGTTTTAVWSVSVTPGQTSYAAAVGGTANAITITTTIPVTLTAGVAIAFQVALTNTGATTVALNGGSAIALRRNSPAGPAATTGGELVASNTALIRYDGALWHIEVTTLGTASKANASSNTGTVAAISGAVTAGHIGVFSDTLGTMVDGGIPGAGVSAVGLNFANGNNVLLGSGSYDINTATLAGGAFAPILPASPFYGQCLFFYDVGGDCDVNYLTLQRNGNTIEGLSENLIINISGLAFQIWWNGSTWRVS